jgi:hypothetical protein
MKPLCLFAAAAGICAAANSTTVIANGINADYSFYSSTAAGPRYGYVSVSELAARSQSSREVNVFATLLDCTASGFDGVWFQLVTCVSGAGRVPADAFSKFIERGAKAASLEADLANLPEFSLEKYVVNNMTGQVTYLSPPASYQVSIAWRVNGLSSYATTGVVRQAYPGVSYTRAGPSSYESADATGVWSGERLPGSGSLGEYRNVLVTVQR